MTLTKRTARVGVWLAFSLGLVTTLGPAGTDMYLASLPEMVNELGSTSTQGQLTLTVFLLAMGLGPLIDAVGRRVPLLFALVLFVLASVGASLSLDMGVLLAARTLQGLAASMTLVVAMSTVRDRAEGVQATQLFALLMTIQGLAPVLAPSVGGIVDAAFGWRAVFLVLAGLGAVALINSAVSLPESLPRSVRASLRITDILRTYGRIARNGRFLLPALGLAAVFFFLYAYIAGATFVYQQQYGLNTSTFGLLFGATGIAVMLGAIFTGRTVSRWGANRLSVVGATLLVTGAAVALVSAVTGIGLVGIVAGMAIALFGVGVAESTLMALAMSSQHTALGSTAALLGAFQMIIASLSTPIVGSIVEFGAAPWLSFLLGAATVAVVIVTLSAKRSPAITDLAH
jgi:DHA1 family bicyclomycin/chloramphenicol resistance-like MFS transporter